MLRVQPLAGVSGGRPGAAGALETSRVASVFSCCRPVLALGVSVTNSESAGPTVLAKVPLAVPLSECRQTSRTASVPLRPNT